MSGPQPSADELGRLFETVIGTVTFRVSDLGRERDFYARSVGLEAREDGPAEWVLSDREGRDLLRLDDTEAGSSEPLSSPHTGLFHIAFRYPDRSSLGAAVRRMLSLSDAYQGASDHGVSEAVYFGDPEGNGIELYCDRAWEEWPAATPGSVGMTTRPLDLDALLGEALEDGVPAECDVGHIHLMTADVAEAAEFWRDAIGLNERQRFGPQAIFLADGLYHHHIGANTWHSAGAPAAPADRPGLASFELCLSSAEKVDLAAARLEESGVLVAVADGQVTTHDPDGNRVVLRSA